MIRKRGCWTKILSLGADDRVVDSWRHLVATEGEGAAAEAVDRMLLARSAAALEAMVWLTGQARNPAEWAEMIERIEATKKRIDAMTPRGRDRFVRDRCRARYGTYDPTLPCQAAFIDKLLAEWEPTAKPAA